MNILGINIGETAFGKRLNDGGACLLVGNQLVAAIAEERLNRKKSSGGFKKSAKYCLNAAGLSPRELDLVVVSSCCDYPNQDLLWKKINEHLKVAKKKVALVNHHLSHAYSAYMISPFDEALVVVMDAGGNLLKKAKEFDWWKLDREQNSYYLAKGNNLNLIDRDFSRPYECGYGETYRAFTHFFGWHSYKHSSRTMALSSSGNSDAFKGLHLFRNIEDGRIISGLRNNPKSPINMVKEYLRQNDITKCNPREPDGEILKIHENLAKFLQEQLEKSFFRKLRYLNKKYKIKNLCLAGGVGLNCLMNGKILDKTGFNNLFVQPAANDQGQCLGNALFGYHKIYSTEERLPFTPFLGINYNITEKFLYQKLKEQSLENNVVKLTSLKPIVKLLSEGYLIAWFQGKSEFGPRALGNRSIIGDPRSTNIKYLLNRYIKKRDCFMPYAPSVILEKANEYFDINDESPYMLKAVKTRHEKKEFIKSVVHEDNTSRIQTVSKQFNQKYYSLLKQFNDLTGMPMLLNTSFNRSGEPIVETPKDAISCFKAIDIPFLVMEEYLIAKDSRMINTLVDIEPASQNIRYYKTKDIYRNQLFDTNNIADLETKLKKTFPGYSLFGRNKIVLYDKFYQWLINGKKSTTIRYKKNGLDFPESSKLELWSAEILGSNRKSKKKGIITVQKFVIKRYNKLTDHDAKLDGFNNLNELKSTLNRIYGNIAGDALVSIYHLEF